MMNSLTDLNQLLLQLNPTLCEQEFVFICRPHSSSSNEAEQHAVASVVEKEGRTLVIPKQVADRCNEFYVAVFRRITLQVQSSLEAVGLTAAVSNQLRKYNIAANVIAGFHHDHVFVPSLKAREAINALNDLNPDA